MLRIEESNGLPEVRFGFRQPPGLLFNRSQITNYTCATVYRFGVGLTSFQSCGEQLLGFPIPARTGIEVSEVIHYNRGLDVVRTLQFAA
jgi:hypothetical protein